jgi:ribosomal protein S18 acetylase RimI-like enzyme
MQNFFLPKKRRKMKKDEIKNPEDILTFQEFNTYVNRLNDKVSIIEYKSKYAEDVKDLLDELERYICKIDKLDTQKMWPDYREREFNDTINEVEQKQGKIYLALINQKAIGLIIGIIRTYEKEDLYTLDTSIIKGVITELVVNENYRCLGIGDKLMSKIEKYFKSKNCKYVFVDVFGPNINAQKFYNKYGYNPCDYTLVRRIQ